MPEMRLHLLMHRDSESRHHVLKMVHVLTARVRSVYAVRYLLRVFAGQKDDSRLSWLVRVLDFKY